MAAPVDPPPQTRIPPIVVLPIRLLTLVCLLISTALIASNKLTIQFSRYLETSAKFNVFYAYRYLLSCTVLGLFYTLLQTILTLLHLTTTNTGGLKSLLHFLNQFHFYADFIMSNLLISGAAASFGLTVDLKRGDADAGVTNNFFDKVYAATSLCLLAFLFNAVATIISHLNTTTPPKQTT